MRTPHILSVSFLSAVALFAQKPSWPYSMDFGPVLMTTFSGKGLCGDVHIRLGLQRLLVPTLRPLWSEREDHVPAVGRAVVHAHRRRRGQLRNSK